MKECWKPVVGWEGFYEVSSFGSVRSVDRTIHGADGVCQRRKSHVLTSTIQNSGYFIVHLRKPGMSCQRLVHRLVAESFIDNPQSFRFVNHIDENRLNNKVENLEWCTQLYNANYGHAKLKMSNSHLNNKSLSRPVIATDKNGNKTTYPSANEASRRTGVGVSNIVRCCNKVKYYITAGGYSWSYA